MACWRQSVADWRALRLGLLLTERLSARNNCPPNDTMRIFVGRGVLHGYRWRREGGSGLRRCILKTPTWTRHRFHGSGLPVPVSHASPPHSSIVQGIHALYSAASIVTKDDREIRLGRPKDERNGHGCPYYPVLLPYAFLAHSPPRPHKSGTRAGPSSAYRTRPPEARRVALTDGWTQLNQHLAQLDTAAVEATTTQAPTLTRANPVVFPLLLLFSQRRGNDPPGYRRRPNGNDEMQHHHHHHQQHQIPSMPLLPCTTTAPTAVSNGTTHRPTPSPAHFRAQVYAAAPQPQRHEHEHHPFELPSRRASSGQRGIDEVIFSVVSSPAIVTTTITAAAAETYHTTNEAADMPAVRDAREV
ncbi:hypothetical protein FPV67DRAFT_1751797 [Lyophyllum atratum]|nr:hypothetical protein FPV67DRAFT_1751797 [Lyophyllum atratum]